MLSEQQMLQLIPQPKAISGLPFEIGFFDPAVEAFVFAFG